MGHQTFVKNLTAPISQSVSSHTRTFLSFFTWGYSSRVVASAYCQYFVCSNRRGGVSSRNSRESRKNGKRCYCQDRPAAQISHWYCANYWWIWHYAVGVLLFICRSFFLAK